MCLLVCGAGGHWRCVVWTAVVVLPAACDAGGGRGRLVGARGLCVQAGGCAARVALIRDVLALAARACEHASMRARAAGTWGRGM